MKQVVCRVVLMLATCGCLASMAISQELPPWVKSMKLSGDVSFRTDVAIDKKTEDNYDRVRERLRFRLVLDTMPVDNVNVSLGMGTSTAGNPNSTWADFTDFQNQPLYLTHAYVRYTPTEYLTVAGGKLKTALSSGCRLS